MGELGYDVILVDLDLALMPENVTLLQSLCNKVFVLSSEDLISLYKKESMLSNCVVKEEIAHILYVSKSQKNIYQMNEVFSDVSCCFVHDAAIDYADIEAKHEIPHIKKITRIRNNY